MDVTNAEQAKIAEDAGACAVMALERIPSDIRRDGGVARMSDPDMIQEIKDTVSIPVMAKCRIGHFAEAQILQALEVDFIDESERLFDVTHPVVTNMGRFLQSLDADGNPENGITISEHMRSEVNGRMIDFHQSIMDFGSDPDTEALYNTLNGLNMPHNDQIMIIELDRCLG